MTPTPAPLMITDGHLTVEISPHGAEMRSVRTADGSEWLWNGDARWWTGRAPLLFPVIGTSPDGAVTIGGRRFDMPSHGIARISTFGVEHHDATSVRLSLGPAEGTAHIYPLGFRLQVEYRIAEGALEVTATVANEGEGPMPFQFGFHPAFVLPLPRSAGQPHSVRLEGEAAPDMRRPGPDGLMGAEVFPSPFRQGGLDIAPGMFAGGAMVFERGAGSSVRLSAEGGAAVTMTVRDLPILALWQKPDAPFLCLEPWTGVSPDAGADPALEARPGVTMLPAGEDRAFVMRLRFDLP